MNKKKIFIINGSASSASSNERIIHCIAGNLQHRFDLDIFNGLKTLPHFDPEHSATNPPQSIVDFRNKISQSDAVLICTPEYVFSIPSGLKNAIEWCVVTTVFSDKPVGIITASASGQKGHEELQMIMKTIQAKFTSETTLLIIGAKNKFDEKGTLTDSKTERALGEFVKSFSAFVENATYDQSKNSDA